MYLAGGTLLQTYKEESQWSFSNQLRRISVYTDSLCPDATIKQAPFKFKVQQQFFLGIVIFNILEHTHWQGSLTKLAGNPVCDSSVCVSPFPDITVSRATEQGLWERLRTPMDFLQEQLHRCLYQRWLPRSPTLLTGLGEGILGYCTSLFRLQIFLSYTQALETKGTFLWE